MKQKHILVVFLFLLALISCKDKEPTIQDKSVNMESAEMMMIPPPPPPPGNTEQGQYNPKLVKKGELRISSENIEATKECIYGFVKSCNGYVTEEKMQKDETESSISIELTVRADLFDRFVHKLDSSKLNIVSRNFTTEDVTMKFIDDSTRLQNKKKLEKKYLELVSRTNDVTDLLAIEGKLESVQSDIESREGQLKMLNKRIAYSEFSITIEKYAPGFDFQERNKFSYKLKMGLIRGWEGIKVAFVILVSIWPLYIIAAIMVIVVTVIKRRRKKNN